MKNKGELFQIVYKSTSKHLMGSKEIEGILEVARRKNEQNGVTGLLMVRGKVFIQLLEGDRKAVEDTYKRIMKDDRHSDIKMIIEGGTNRRIFEKWSMGHIDEAASAETTGQVLKAIDQLAQSPGELRGTILKILIACSSKSHTSRAS